MCTCKHGKAAAGRYIDKNSEARVWGSICNVCNDTLPPGLSWFADLVLNTALVWVNCWGLFKEFCDQKLWVFSKWIFIRLSPKFQGVKKLFINSQFVKWSVNKENCILKDIHAIIIVVVVILFQFISAPVFLKIGTKLSCNKTCTSISFNIFSIKNLLIKQLSQYIIMQISTFVWVS
jgi:hypothetical protein